MLNHHIDYELLVFGVYSNIRKNDRMSSTRVEMLRAGLTTTRRLGGRSDPGDWAVARETAEGSPKGETPWEGANQHCR
jgi:hypothetical protein